jgi:hypothetical protein
MDESFEEYRSERKSFFCPNKLWEEVRSKTKDKISISQYIKQAIIEKMKKDDSQRSEYYDSLLVVSEI